MRRITLPGLLALLLLVPAPPVAARADDRPNVLIVVTDDQRRGTMNVMRYTRRWLQRLGTRYPNAVVTSPVCCPSRGSILTGRYAHNHGIETNADHEALDHETTLQRHLRDAGYLTGMAGKFLNGWKATDDPPHFDRWAVMSGHGYWRTVYNVNGRRVRPQAYSTDFLRARAVRSLRWFERRDDDAPWLLYVAPSAPHAPYEPATRHLSARVPPWRHRSAALGEADLSDKHPIVQERARLKPRAKIRRAQLRTLLSVDEMIRGLRRELRRLNENRRTIVIFLSDNGYLWGEHGMGPGKLLPFKETFRVPMYVRWPGVLPPGGVDRRIAANIDLAPTIYEAAGIEPTVEIDGRSLRSEEERDRILLEYWSHPGRYPTWSALWSLGEQYTEWESDETYPTFTELYDLAEDPAQLTNVLADGDPDNDPSPAHLSALEAALAAARACAGTSGPLACP